MSYSIMYHEMSSPPAAEFLLERPAVDDLLVNAFKKPVTTVIAGAGYGKTQAVLSALKSKNYRSSWMQLSELDNYNDRFWERLAHLLKPHSDFLYESMLSLGYPESIMAFDQFLRLLSTELTLDEQFILIFDDFYFIKNDSILIFFELLISVRIKNFSIVFITRTKPRIKLAGLLSKGLLSCVNEDDLRFSKKEMDAYFHKQRIDVSDTMSSDIYSYTEGWVFALLLIGFAVKKGNISQQNSVLMAKADIFDLIEKEIFDLASSKLQSFLISISVLDVIPASLLRELTEGSPSLVSEMMQMSQFICYDLYSDSYRINLMFKEFLLERRERVEKDEIAAVYLIAAKWYENNNHNLEAIEYYHACGRYNEIFDIILSTQRMSKETADSFIRLIEQAPSELIKKRPVMRVAKARCMFNNNRIEDAKRELSAIRQEYEALPRTIANDAVLGEAYILLALISIVNIDYEFEELFQEAAKCLPNGSRLINNKATIAEGLNICSIKDPSCGELKRHQDALFSIAPYAAGVMNGCGYGTEHLNAAESNLYTADLKAAEKHAYEAIYMSKLYQQHDIEYMANFVLVRIFMAKGKYDKIKDILDQMKEQLNTIQSPICISLYDVIRGWFYTKIGLPDKVAKWIKLEEETRKVLAPVHLGREYLVRTDCLLVEERHYELLAFMEQTDKIYKARGVLFFIIQNNIIKAIVHHYLGNHTESIKYLYEAYELAHPNDLVMQFVEYGNKMRTLIHAARLNSSCKIPAKWLDDIYTKSSTYAKQLSQVTSAYNTLNMIVDTNQVNLSNRELEILTGLYRGLTRAEIAASHFISPSTVSSTIKNIFNKLGATNIADVIRIAKEKNLI